MKKVSLAEQVRRSWFDCKLKQEAKMADMKQVTDAEFKEFVASGGLVLVDFSATWCGPCKKLHPILAEIQTERTDVKIAIVDIQTAPETARSCGVMSVPQVHIFKDGEKVDQFIGLKSKNDIVKYIEKNL
jgi:thioredoxin 1